MSAITVPLNPPTVFVTMKDGSIVAVEAVRLALDLENRGLHFSIDDDRLIVYPRELLNDGDREQIRRWHLHLLAIVAYDATGVQ